VRFAGLSFTVLLTSPSLFPFSPVTQLLESSFALRGSLPVKSLLGLDIGGANLKAAHSSGPCLTRPFALWRDPDGLAGQLGHLLAGLPHADVLAVTMTGELCDCFASKREGVGAILDAVERVAQGRPVRIWTTAGCFVSPDEARAQPLTAAAANWLALATLAGRQAPAGGAVLIDIGSTTTDLIPLRDGKPAPRGRTDPERLRAHELVYAGVLRTPLCAVLGLEAAAELFATTGDVFRVLGSLPEDPHDCNTADGRPATRLASHARLARMLCADLDTTAESDRRRLAERAVLQLAERLSFALREVVGKLGCPLQTALLAGLGSFLARRVVVGLAGLKPANLIDLGQTWGPAVSVAACAHAVAVLASEERGT
jgi:probable H4MPT-linked C1 transfer pathway protein